MPLYHPALLFPATLLEQRCVRVGVIWVNAASLLPHNSLQTRETSAAMRGVCV